MPNPISCCAALGWKDVIGSVPLTGGADAALFQVQRASGQIAVLRVFQPRQRQMAEREAQVMPYAAAHGLPVPQIFAHGLVGDRPAMLMAWAEGERGDSVALHGASAIAALGQAAGRLLADLHAIPPPPGWPTTPDWSEATRLSSDAPLVRALAALETPRPALLHLDLHPLNLFYTSTSSLPLDGSAEPTAEGTTHLRISSLIDWGNASVADPRIDLARALTIAWLDSAAFARPVQIALRTFARNVVSAYCAAVPDVDLSVLPLLLALCGQHELHDLAPRLAQQPQQQRRVERWVRYWSWRAGVSTSLSVTSLTSGA